MICAEADGGDLIGAGMAHGRMLQRPFDDLHRHRSPAMRQSSIPRPSATTLLTSTQRKSSRCSRNDLTGPPSGASERSGSCRRPCGKLKLKPWADWEDCETVEAGGWGLAGLAGVVVAGILNLFRHFARRFLEFLDAAAESLGQFRNALGAKQKQTARMTISHSQPPRKPASIAFIIQRAFHLTPVSSFSKAAKKRPRLLRGLEILTSSGLHAGLRMAKDEHAAAVFAQADSSWPGSAGLSLP
jgi:hypothetical protein